jgi:nitronate monooxygenase
MNSFCALMGVQRPLQQAAMSRVSGSPLVAAVSNAGALGMIAVGRSPVPQVMRQLDELSALTTKPFGAGFIVRFLTRETLEAVAARVKVIEFFYDWPDPALVLPGTITGWQVGTVDEARAAVDAGCAFVIAQGVEAGGHVRSTVPLNVLLDRVRAAVDVPIVAAGGIGSNADVRVAFGLGADAVRIGTRFLGASETDVHPEYRQRLIDARADDAEYTTLFDVGWPDAPQRILASAVAAARLDGPDPVGHMGEAPLPRRGTTPPNRATTGEIGAMALYAGRSVSSLTEVKPAAEIITELLGTELLGTELLGFTSTGDQL